MGGKKLGKRNATHQPVIKKSTAQMTAWRPQPPLGNRARRPESNYPCRCALAHQRATFTIGAGFCAAVRVGTAQIVTKSLQRMMRMSDNEAT